MAGHDRDREELVTPRVQPRSRVHGPRRVLKELYRVRLKILRALEYRDLSDDEQRWSRDVDASLERLTRTGELVLPGLEDPRDRRRVRKRQDRLF